MDVGVARALGASVTALCMQQRFGLMAVPDACVSVEQKKRRRTLNSPRFRPFAKIPEERGSGAAAAPSGLVEPSESTYNHQQVGYHVMLFTSTHIPQHKSYISTPVSSTNCPICGSLHICTTSPPMHHSLPLACSPGTPLTQGSRRVACAPRYGWQRRPIGRRSSVTQHSVRPLADHDRRAHAAQHGGSACDRHGPRLPAVMLSDFARVPIRAEDAPRLGSCVGLMLGLRRRPVVRALCAFFAKPRGPPPRGENAPGRCQHPRPLRCPLPFLRCSTCSATTT